MNRRSLIPAFNSSKFTVMLFPFAVITTRDPHRLSLCLRSLWIIASFMIVDAFQELCIPRKIPARSFFKDQLLTISVSQGILQCQVHGKTSLENLRLEHVTICDIPAVS